jgi:U4/U6 small nuclear ribonucleoprotein PRP31
MSFVCIPRQIETNTLLMATPDYTFFTDLNELELDDDDDADFDFVGDLNSYDDDDLFRSRQRYTDILLKLQKAEEADDSNVFGGYKLVMECNLLSAEIENEIVIVHNFIRNKYCLKFPELESIVHHPVDYARVVKKIGNQIDPTLFDLQGLLPSSIIMVVSITSSTTSGKPLPNQLLNNIIDACDLVIALDSLKNKIVDLVESKISYVAPNLFAVVGSIVAAKLVVTAGGLSSLANMPACNVQLLESKQINPAGFSSASSQQFYVGCLEQTQLIQTTPPHLRMRAYRLLAAKSTLAARVDLIHGDPSGKIGTTLKDEILTKIDKWQEPPPAKRPKPLPVPDSDPKKKKRGGRRLRKMKEKYTMADKRKLTKANRMQFGIAEESCLGSVCFTRFDMS